VDSKSTDLNQAMAAEIRAERGAAQLTQVELAVRSGISYSTLKRILNGTVDVSVADLGAIAAALSTVENTVTPQELLRRAVERAGGYTALLSAPSATQDEIDAKRKQDEVRTMTVAQIEALPHAATRDPEMDTDQG